MVSPTLKNNRGQMALIMIFIAAIALIFYAMSLNVSKVSQTKLQVTVASNQAAAGLASKMASYGEQLLQSSLGGEKEKCDWSGFFMAFLTYVIIVIIIIVAVATQQYWAAVIGPITVGALLTVAAVIAMAAMILQLVYIQPGLSKMWNKMQQNIVTQEDQFREMAFKEALLSAISDNEKIKDVYDLDMDGRFASLTDPKDDDPTTSRFGYYYTQHMEGFENVKLIAVQNFIEAVNGLLSDLGLDADAGSTPGCQPSNAPRQFWDPCCVPKQIRSPSCSGGSAEMKVEDWDDVPSPECDTPYASYQLAYDPLFWARQADLNDPSTITLAWLIGLDDGNPAITKDVDNNACSNEHLMENEPYLRGEDSSGGIIPLLWSIRDTTMKVQDLPLPAADARSCNWCAEGVGTTCNNYDTAAGYRFWKYPDGTPFTRLELGAECAGLECCVSYFKTPTAGVLDTRQIDKIGDLNPTLFADADPAVPIDCPDVWRAGSDMFCTDDIPYYVSPGGKSPCPNHNAQCYNPAKELAELDKCSCEKLENGDKWHTDDFDKFDIFLRRISAEVGHLFGNQHSRLALANTYDSWYEDVKAALAELATWRNKMAVWQTSFRTWLTADYRDNANSLWCLPSDESAVPAKEREYLKRGNEDGPVTWDKLTGPQPIIDCLRYNVLNPTGGIIDNEHNEAIKYENVGFEDCLNACKENDALIVGDLEECQNMPRSLAYPAGQFISAQLAGSTCGDALPILQQSYDLALDQAAKMEKRAEYLEKIGSYISTIDEKLEEFIGIIDKAIPDIEAKMEEIEKENAQATEGKMLYGWRSEPSGLAPDGLWHLAQVEAWLPKRCEGFNCCTKKFPWIKSEKGTFENCYKLRDHSGRVKVRVLRYDESPQSGKPLTFANKIPLWEFRSGNPFKGGDESMKYDGGQSKLCACQLSKGAIDGCDGHSTPLVAAPGAVPASCVPIGDNEYECTETIWDWECKKKKDARDDLICCPAGTVIKELISSECTIENPNADCHTKEGKKCKFATSKKAVNAIGNCVSVYQGSDACDRECLTKIRCGGRTPPHWEMDMTVAPGAFLIYGDNDLIGRSADCQAAVRDALTQAVASETCAYYFMKGDKYTFKFSNCREYPEATKTGNQCGLHND